MASIQIEEPWVRAREIIRNYPVQLNITGETNIGGVIVAPTGPKLAFISGPQDFLDNYTVDGNVPRNAHISFLNAYYLSFSAGLVIARSLNTTAVNGLFFTPVKIQESKLLVNFSSETIWGLEFGGTYYWCNDGDANWNNFITYLKGLYDDNAGDYRFSEADIKHLEELHNTQNTVNCSSPADLADKLEEVLNGDTFKDTEDKANVIWDETAGAYLITPKLDPASFPVQAAYGLNTIARLYNPNANNAALKATSINYKDGVALTETDYYDLIFDSSIDGNWAFTYGTMAYYHGAIDKSKYADYSLVQCDSMDDIVTSINGINGMSSRYEVISDNHFKLIVNYSQGNKLIISMNGDPLLEGVQIGINANTTSVDMSMMLFAIYPSDPQDSNKYKLIVQPGADDYFKITLTDGDTSESYEVSLLSDGLDSTGNNCFIENLNTLGIGYTFVTNPDYDQTALVEATPIINQVFSFGESGLDLSASSNVTCMVNALNTLADQELYDIEYLAPFGITDAQFIKNYTMIGKANDWFTPVDIPYNKTNANSIKSYFLNVTNDSNVFACGPFDKNSGLLGWQFYLAASTLYYTRVMQNTQANSKWAPVFEQTNGILDYTNPCYTLGKEEREKLLNFKCPVNFAVYNQRLSVYYFNDNRTHQYINNIVSEEQNRRCVNEIKKNCVRLLKKFKGELNTVTTRSNVVSTLDYYFQQSVMNQNYHPNEYQIVCDESNNTTEIINANKLAVTVRVRLENAIKFIDILTDIFPLGIEFSE